MAYERTTWVDDDGSLQVGTPVSAATMNNLEDGVEQAIARADEVAANAATIEDLIAGSRLPALPSGSQHSHPVFVAPFPCEIVAAQLVPWPDGGAGNIAASDSGYWTVSLRRWRLGSLSGSPIASKTTALTGGEGMVGGKPWTFDAVVFGAEQVLAQNDVVEFLFNPTGGASAPAFAVGPLAQLRYRPLA